MIFNDLSISLNERERCLRRLRPNSLNSELRLARRCRARWPEKKTKPMRIAPSTTERCLIVVRQILVKFTIRWMSPVLRAIIINYFK
jgi:hypothetical protein